MLRHGRLIAAFLAVYCTTFVPTNAFAQTFGTELQNVLMPAAGGMAGVSIAQPQDVVSAINANPATLRQFEGTQFLFGGTWAEPTMNMTQTAPIPLLGVLPFSGKSTAPGSGGASIGISQSFDSTLGLPISIGLGFVTAAGGAVDFRPIVESNGTNCAFSVFETPMTVGVGLTERWSIGAGLALGIALFDGPFVGSGGMTPDYALRGVVGTNYLAGDATSLGCYYQTKQAFRFDDAVRLTAGPITTYQDVRMDLPENIGLGIANNRLCDGKLLVATDVVYKLWDGAALYKAIYNNQWVFQFGSQYSLGRYRLRAGYTYAENPVAQFPINNVGGIIPPGGPLALRYTQGLLAVTNPHRISGGLGVTDVMPGVDFDLMAGGMFKDTAQLGPATSTSIASYWAGFGMTWRFGGCCNTRKSGENCPANCTTNYTSDNYTSDYTGNCTANCDVLSE